MIQDFGLELVLTSQCYAAADTSYPTSAKLSSSTMCVSGAGSAVLQKPSILIFGQEILSKIFSAKKKRKQKGRGWVERGLKVGVDGGRGKGE